MLWLILANNFNSKSLYVYDCLLKSNQWKVERVLIFIISLLTLIFFQGIIFVVDSSDRLRMVVAKDELDMLLQVG